MMKNISPWFAKPCRDLARALGVLAVVACAYGWAAVRHGRALALVEDAKGQIARSDWLAAVRSLDDALGVDRYNTAETHLLRATAINGAIATTGRLAAGHDRNDALADINVFLASNPNSGEAYYQRLCARRPG